eukprot:c19800_g1_i1 orf=207-575(-)
MAYQTAHQGNYIPTTGCIDHIGVSFQQSVTLNLMLLYKCTIVPIESAIQPTKMKLPANSIETRHLILHMPAMHILGHTTCDYNGEDHSATEPRDFARMPRRVLYMPSNPHCIGVILFLHLVS